MDASYPSIPVIAGFMEFLFKDKNWKPGTVRGLKAALGDYYDPNIL